MVGEIVRGFIVSLTQFDWGIAVPFFIFAAFCIALIADVERDYKDNKGKVNENSRYYK